MAYEGNADAISLPTPALAGDTLDFSFSGIKTATLNYLNGMAQKGEEINRANVAASYTNGIVGAIVKKTEQALKQTNTKTLVLAGGVAANSHLRGALEALCRSAGVRLAMPDRSLCGDNGAMVAMQGYFEFMAGKRASLDLNASAVHVEL